MSKERLEEIIHKEAYLEGTNNLVMVINTDDYKWLIKQAERVQELETFKEEMENRYKIWHMSAKKSLAEKEELKQQNKRYRALLERVCQVEDLEDVWDIEDDYKSLEESE